MKMRIWKKAFPMILSALLLGLSIVLPLFLSAAGSIQGNVHGFDLDAEENLYIGTDRSILVYKGREKTRTIRLQPAMEYDYRFMIQDNTIVVGSRKWSTAKVYDLEGHFLSNRDLQYESIRRNETGRVSAAPGGNGSIYSMETYQGFAPTKILLNGEILYRQPLMDFLFTGLPATCIRIVLLGFFALSLLAFVGDKEVNAQLSDRRGGSPA